MSNRSANATIRGYIYQFDETIAKIITSNMSQSIIVEDIEDIDIVTQGNREAIQCKYLPSKSYSLASIRDAILPMLADMLARKRNAQNPIYYKLFAYFSESQPQSINLNLEELKTCLQMRKQDGTLVDYRVNLGATDKDLTAFLALLKIELAEDYDSHKNKIYGLIKKEYSCSDGEIEFYYNNALSVIAQMASYSDSTKRSIIKREFFNKTKNKHVLYSIWRLQELGKDKYCREIRKKHFTISNIPSYARFFIIELDGTETKALIKEVLLELRPKWSSHERRRKPEKERYAPYVLLQGIQPDLLANIKRELLDEGIQFTDGFPFEGATFNVDELNKLQTRDNQLSLRFINDDKLMPEIIVSLKRQTKEIYRFYRKQPFDVPTDLKYVQFRIEDISFVKEMI
jgi:hypothetical protein